MIRMKVRKVQLFDQKVTVSSVTVLMLSKIGIVSNLIVLFFLPLRGLSTHKLELIVQLLLLYPLVPLQENFIIPFR